MPQPPKRNKTLDLKWNLGFWQENAEGGKKEKEKKTRRGELEEGKENELKNMSFWIKSGFVCVWTVLLWSSSTVVVVLVKTND